MKEAIRIMVPTCQNCHNPQCPRTGKSMPSGMICMEWR